MKPGLFLAVATVVLSAAASAGTITIRNDAYGFEVTVPDSWTSRKTVQEDPDEAMQSGKFSFSIDTEQSGPEPKNWNAIEFNNEGSSADEPPPVVLVSAHRKPGQKPEAFAQMIEDTVRMWGGKMLAKTKTASGFDYTYHLFTNVRVVVRYENGVRYAVQYMVPSTDPKVFEKHAAAVDAVVKSLRTR